jgi:hypothetical protein
MDASQEIASLDEDLVKEEWVVLAAFGRVMLSAQVLETTVFQLAHLDRKTPNGLERCPPNRRPPEAAENRSSSAVEGRRARTA